MVAVVCSQRHCPPCAPSTSQRCVPLIRHTSSRAATVCTVSSQCAKTLFISTKRVHGGGYRRQRLQCHASAASNSPLVPNSNKKKGDVGGNGVFLLLLFNVVLFLTDHLLLLRPLKLLYLNHAHPQIHQFITHMFMHANASHLTNNLFLLLIFGKLVEETEGSLGVWFVYIVTGLGAAIATYFLTPAWHNGAATVSVGASGAIFGLFAVSVLTRLTSGFNLKRLLEAVILGQFVVRQVLEEAKNQAMGGLVVGGLSVSHLAHLAGALAGVFLVMLLHRLPAE